MKDYLGKQFGSYRLISLIGQGGFANVYLGEHVYLPLKAAIKILQTQLTSEDRRKFLDEARMLASLMHPHIIRVLDFGIVEKENIPFLVMDYAEKGTLRQAYPRGACVPLERAIAYINHVADALQYAHDRGLVHRDVKPENMLIGINNTILLSDFGIAVASHTQNAPVQGHAEVVGTIAYMAPEQLQGRPRSASDQYALAVVAYEWLCGSAPFQGSFIEIMSQHMSASPTPLRKRNAQISRDVEEVIMIALSKDPERRFRSVRAFANALTKAAQISVSSQNEPHSIREALPKTEYAPIEDDSKVPLKMSRRTMIAVTAGSVVVTLGALSGISWYIYEQSQKGVQPSTPKHRQGELIFTYRGHQLQVNTVAWSPDGTHLVSGSNDDSVQTWTIQTQNAAPQSPQYGDSVNSVAWSSDKRQIAVGVNDGSLWVIDVSSGEGRSYSPPDTYGAIHAVSISSDGKYVLVGYDNGILAIWDIGAEKIVNQIAVASAVNSVAWSPLKNDARTVCGNADGTVVVKASTAKQDALLTHLQNTSVVSVGWSPDAALIASADANSVRIWLLLAPAGRDVATLHSSGVLALTWSPDGKYIALGGANNEVQIWSVAGQRLVYTYTGHKNQVNAVAWSPDGKLIASASSDKTVQVWYPFAG